MSGIHPLRRLRTGMLVVAGLCAMVHGAVAFGPRVPFDDLVAKSDQIFTATCTERESVLQNGVIVTRYKLRPKEFWKGSAKLNKAGEIEFEEIGGQIEKPIPVGTTATGMADFSVGEDVLLFTRTPNDKARSGKPKGREILKAGSLRIVGRDQGRFSVFKHPETGEPIVARHQPRGMDAKIQRQAEQRAQKRIGELQAKGARPAGQTTETLTKQYVAEERTKLARPLGARLDQAGVQAKALRDQEAKRDPRLAEEVYTFESLESVKARVGKSLSRPAQ